MTTKTFINQFSDGTSIRLDFDLSGPALKCTSSRNDMSKQPSAIQAEFRKWVDGFVMPDVYANLNELQIIDMALRGHTALKL